MKKLLAFILTLALILTAVPLTVAFAEDDGVFVVADGVTYKVHQGDTLDYAYYLNLGEKMTSLDGSLIYDSGALTLNVPADEEEGEEDISLIFPIISGAVVVNDKTPSLIKYNFSLPQGKSFTSDTSALIKARFTVTASSGTYRIDNAIVTMGGLSGTVYVADGQVKTAPAKMAGGLDGRTPYDPAAPDATVQPTQQPTQQATQQPTEKATAAPATEPGQTASGDVFVVADGVTFKVHQGDVFEYVYYLCTGEQLCSLDGEFFYGADGLEAIIPENDDDLTVEMLFSRIKSSVIVHEIDPGRIKFNYSNARGKAFDKETYSVVKAQFRVTASEGTYEIRTVLHTVAGADEHRYLYNDKVVDPLKKCEGTIPALTPYDPDQTEPPTQAPTPAPTEPPTQAPTPAPTEPPTQAPTPAPTEPPTQAPTPAPTEPPTQAPTPAPTEPPTQAPTPAPTEPPTQAPTPAPTEPPTQPEAPPEGLFVKADGVLYEVAKGETFTYTYYLNLNDRLCSLDGDLYYDADGLDIITPVNEDGESEIALIFPVIGDGVVLNTGLAGRINYNYSSAKGKAFKKDTSRLIEAQFVVKAESGVLEINNFLHVVAGQEEKKYIFGDEIIEAPRKSAGALPEKEPYDPSAETKILTDPATGIKVAADVDAALTVREIAPGDFNYYLYDSGNLRLFEISLEKDGKPIALTAPVKVMFPEAYCRAVYRFKDGIFTDAQAASDTSGYRTVRTDTLGLFVTSKTDTPPKAEKYGNVDGDDVITIVDVSYIQRHLAGIRKFDADQIRIADVDGDGDVTIVDGAYIQRWLAGMLSDNPMTRFGYPKQ